MKESLKPIEPGCLVYISPLAFSNDSQCQKLAGTIVEAGSRYDGNRFLEECRCKRLRGECSWWLADTTIGVCESMLTRIDPDDEIREDETQLDAANELERTLRKAGVWSE